MTTKLIHLPLHVEQGGNTDGLALVFLHGFPQSSYAWRKVLSHPNLQKYHLIAPDLRGMGDSPLDNKIHPKKILAADIAEVLNSLQKEKAIIIGHDWGGAVAQRFAIDYPERTQALVCINTFFLPSIRLQNLLLSKQIRYSWYLILHALPFIPELLAAQDTRAYLMTVFKDGIKSGAIQKNDLAEYLRIFEQPDRAQAYFNLYRTARHDQWHNYRTHFKNIACLWLHGSQDKFVPQSELQNIDQYFASFELLLNTQAGHWIVEEDPDFIAKNIDQFAAKMSV